MPFIFLEDYIMDNITIPKHIGIIMDGNGRWAKKRGMPRTAGHKAGAEAFRRIANYCRTLGVRYLTVYAFSTENWKRPKSEVDALMTLLRNYMKTCLKTAEFPLPCRKLIVGRLPKFSIKKRSRKCDSF